MGLQTQFKNLLRDIEPSATTKSSAGSAHTALRAYLASHEDYRDLHLGTFLAGSYVRDTAIRPRTVDGKTSRPDVDIIVVTNYTKASEPKEVLKLLREVLGEKYDLEDRVNDRSVGVRTASVDMDVVPIIAPDGMNGPLFIADRRLETWLPTNPPGHTEWATATNSAAGGRFKPLVKLVKWWWRHSARSKRPKGFVIETVVAECMDPKDGQYATLFVGTLEAIVNRYQIHVLAKTVPQIPDPSVPGNIVTKRLSFDDFELFYEEAQTHAELGRQALEESDSDKALEMWREILPRFPASGKMASSASLLTTAAVSTSLVFPDRPVVPKKPGGFA